MWERFSVCGTAYTARWRAGSRYLDVAALALGRGWIVSVSLLDAERLPITAQRLDGPFPPIAAGDRDEALALMELRVLDVERAGPDAVVTETLL